MAQPQAQTETEAKPSVEDALQSDMSVVEQFMKSHTAYELLPESGKVVVIDVGLSISSAFQALAENGIVLFSNMCFFYTRFSSRNHCSTTLGWQTSRV